MSNEFNEKCASKYKDKLKAVALDRNATYKDIFTLFAIERAVVRLLSNEKLAKSLIFKGGFVCVRVYNSPRYTIDLDSVLHGCSLQDAEELVPKVVQQDLSDGLWFHYESSQVLKTQSEYGGLRLQFRVGFYPILKDIRRATILHIDLGTGDPVTPHAQKLNSNSLVGADEISWLVYPVETICAEKIHPFIVLGLDNSRSKDVFDLSILLHRCNIDTLKKALAKTFQYRNTLLPKNFYEFFVAIETTVLNRGWNAATKAIRPHQPKFTECWNNVTSFFQREGL
jgi:predicted nucleotidyltransferase component of viral defense system